MKTIKMGISGDVGSFSEEAAIDYAKRENIALSPHYLIDMEGVLSALEKGEIEKGILPVVNLLGGLVKPAFLAMGRHSFTPIDELWHKVQQCLLVLPGTRPEQITAIVSHPQGLAQCKHYLARDFKTIPQVEWLDTARAARDLAEGQLEATSAVIAPARAAEVYGLSLMAKNIQDSEKNLTAFIIVEPRVKNHEKNA